MDEVAGEGAEEGVERVGARLRAAREARGITLASIAERSRIPLRHLATIERGDHGGLPALPYTTGFVKVFAQLVGLDGAELSRQFRAEESTIDRVASRQEPYEPVDPKRVPSRLIAIVALVCAILLALGYLFGRGRTSGDEVARIAAGPDQTPPPSPTPLSARGDGQAPAGTADPVTLSADRDVWMKVYEMGGRTLFMGVLGPGDRYVVPADAVDPRIQTGRPEGLRVTVGDAAVAPLGAEAERIRDRSLSPASLRAGRAAPLMPRPTGAASPSPGPASSPAPAPPAGGRPSGQSPPTVAPAGDPG